MQRKHLRDPSMHSFIRTGLALLLAPILFYIPWRRRMERKAKL